MFKITEIDRLFLEYKVIFERLKTCDPDLFDTTILASILHSFYNGIENIFSIIAKNIDKRVPNGNKSHQKLLLQMLNSNNCRTTRVIDEKLYSRNELNKMKFVSKPFGWRYGVNKQKKFKDGSITIEQYAVDFYGNSEMIKKI